MNDIHLSLWSRWLIGISYLGPILRIAPDQVHFNDPEFLGEIYPGPAKKTDKPRRYASMFGQSGSAFATGFHDLHRARRALLNPFFSKRSITSLEPVIQSAVDTLCRRLEGFRESKEIVNMRHAYVALTTDVIRQYCFATSDNDLEAPKFNPFWWVLLLSENRSSGHSG